MNRRLFLTTLSLSPLFANEFVQKNSDIFLSYSEHKTLINLDARFKRLSAYIGFANFNLVSFDEALYYARNYPTIGKFKDDELSLIEKFFHEDPNVYGFYGAKTCGNLNNKVSVKDVVKIPYTGHYLFKGKPQEDYNKLIKDVGASLILTSGVRNIVKQVSLYAGKLKRNGGNITNASRDIAPPSYSYHTISDFDVGLRGWGYENFTEKFATTREFEVMTKLSYIKMRYQKNNSDGVRFEPWHVEVI